MPGNQTWMSVARCTSEPGWLPMAPCELLPAEEDLAHLRKHRPGPNPRQDIADKAELDGAGVEVVSELISHLLRRAADGEFFGSLGGDAVQRLHGGSAPGSKDVGRARADRYVEHYPGQWAGAPFLVCQLAQRARRRVELGGGLKAGQPAVPETRRTAKGGQGGPSDPQRRHRQLCAQQ